jgi:hypothetical protein
MVCTGHSIERRELGTCVATFYKWRAKFGGIDATLMARTKELAEENRRLKKMYIEEKIKAEIVAEALAKASGAREARATGGAAAVQPGVVDGLHARPVGRWAQLQAIQRDRRLQPRGAG